MKSFQAIAIFASLMLCFVAVQAQPPGGRDGERGGRMGRNMDPGKMAARQTENMTEHLALSEEQIPQVQEINLKYANKMKAMRDEMRSQREKGEEVDRMAMMGMMTDLQAAQAKEFKAVLDKSQYKEWKKEQMRRQQQWEERRANGGQGRPGGQGGPGGTPPNNH